MSLHNLGKNHLDPAQEELILNEILQLEQALTGNLIDLSPEDRQKYGSISEQNKLLVNKVLDYFLSQPQHSAPEVDWMEFKGDHHSRQFWGNILMRLYSLIHQIESTKMLHDYDNYQDALTDYAFTQYRAERNIPGAFEKANTLKQFFNRTGTTNSPKEDIPPTE
jgi:hypothetical protein